MRKGSKKTKPEYDEDDFAGDFDGDFDDILDVSEEDVKALREADAEAEGSLKEAKAQRKGQRPPPQKSKRPKQGKRRPSGARRADSRGIDPDEWQEGEEILAGQQEADEVDVPYYEKKPRVSGKYRFMAGVAVTSIALYLIFGPISTISALYLNRALTKVEGQVEATYNPSVRERSADLAMATIYAYYRGDENPPVSIGRGVTWPGGVDSENVSIGEEESGDDSVEGVNSLQSDAKIQATVRNLALLRGNIVERKGTDAEISRNPNMETGVVENLTFQGEFNGQMKLISVSFFYPGFTNPSELTQADRVQPPILVSPPTVSDSETPVIGAPGNTNLGGIEGERSQLDNIPQPVEASIVAWADSWTADDRQGLRSIIQDPENRAYGGLTGGWTMQEGSLSMNWAYLRERDNLMVVSVSFVAQQNVSRGRGDAEETLTTDNVQNMEVLVNFENKGTPAVVAWGVSGSGFDLEPFQNVLRPGSGRAENNDRSTAPSASKSADSEDYGGYGSGGSGGDSGGTSGSESASESSDGDYY